MFSSLDTGDLLEAAIGDTPPSLLSSSRIVPLQLSALSSSSDALPSSLVITFNIADHDPPTEDGQPKQEEGAAHEDRRSQSHDSLGKKEGKARRKTRRRRIGQSSFTNSTDVISGSSMIDTAFTSEKSIDRPHSTHCHSSTGYTSTSQHDRDCASMLDREEVRQGEPALLHSPP